jgi:hypothetical protein
MKQGLVPVGYFSKNKQDGTKLLRGQGPIAELLS